MISRIVVSIFLLSIVLSCSSSQPEFENLEAHIDYLIEENRYEEALNLIHSENPDTPERDHLLEKTYLNYGLYNMSTFDAAEMRTRMNDALRQFVEVLRINPGNQMARSQIDQILQVYETIPARQPEDDVLDALREIGYTI